MGFIIFMVFVWIVVSAIRTAARKQQQQARIILPPDFFGTHNLPPEHVRHILPAPAAVLPARLPMEESSSELMVDETAADHDLDLGHAEVTSLEAVHTKAVTPRPLPGAAASLEAEVDWEAEHQRFHKRYVDARQAAASPAHGLMEELRNPAGARRAVLMAEILGPPVSMRR